MHIHCVRVCVCCKYILVLFLFTHAAKNQNASTRTFKCTIFIFNKLRRQEKNHHRHHIKKNHAFMTSTAAATISMTRVTQNIWTLPDKEVSRAGCFVVHIWWCQQQPIIAATAIIISLLRCTSEYPHLKYIFFVWWWGRRRREFGCIKIYLIRIWGLIFHPTHHAQWLAKISSLPHTHAHVRVHDV